MHAVRLLLSSFTLSDLTSELRGGVGFLLWLVGCMTRYVLAPGWQDVEMKRSIDGEQGGVRKKSFAAALREGEDDGGLVGEQLL